MVKLTYMRIRMQIDRDSNLPFLDFIHKKAKTNVTCEFVEAIGHGRIWILNPGDTLQSDYYDLDYRGILFSYCV